MQRQFQINLISIFFFGEKKEGAITANLQDFRTPGPGACSPT